MKFPVLPLCAALTFLPAAQAAAPATAGDTARCEVWARELSFAQAVADHDADAFAAHLHPSAVFGVTRERPLRGAGEILAGWQGIIDGSALRLRWYPDRVHAGGDGRIVSSSGPALYQDPAGGSHRLGRFNSVWQLGGDGVWRVVFDDGIDPKPADDAQVQAFHAGRSTRCPPG